MVWLFAAFYSGRIGGRLWGVGRALRVDPFLTITRKSVRERKRESLLIIQQVQLFRENLGQMDNMHIFYRLIHQGTRIIPADFIAPAQSHNKEHTGRVFRLQFDEFQIVSSSHDDTILIWDLIQQ